MGHLLFLIIMIYSKTDLIGHSIFLIIVILLRVLINVKSDIKDLDMGNEETHNGKKKPIVYISDGVELKTSFRKHYFEILDMRAGTTYDREMIFEQAQKQHSYYQEDIKVGYKTRSSKEEIQLAESYILEYYDYVINLNWYPLTSFKIWLFMFHIQKRYVLSLKHYTIDNK